jgi:putative DNA primase/helicase
MLAAPRWVAWTYVPREGKQTKVPINPATGANAASTDPSTWGTHADALKRAVNSGLAGVGFVLGDGWVGIDFDDFRERDGRFSEPVPSAVRLFGTYAEVSPSKTGVKIIGRGKLPEGYKNRTGKNDMGREIEVYDSGRYFTVTGEKLDDAPVAVRDISEELGLFCREHMPKRPSHDSKPQHEVSGTPVAGPGSVLTDEDVIAFVLGQSGERGDELRLMWGGGIPERFVNDDSVADGSLLNEIVYYTGGDLDQADRVFRQSGLYRDKWERESYRLPTLNHVLSGRGPDDFYRPKAHVRSHRDPEREAARKLTDLGNAERLATRIEGKALFVHEAKGWYVYTGKRWEPDTTGEVYRHASDTARAIYAEAEDAPTRADRKATAKWAVTSESKTRLDAMVAMAARIKGMTVSAAVFDTDPNLLACNNGTIDLRTGELRPSRPEDYVTKLAPVNWQGPDAPTPRWHKFLEEILPDAELRDFIQVAAGYGASGLSNARAFFICHGSGRNGKSTFLETIRDVIGDYGHTAKPETFLVAKRDGGAASTDVASLKGARLVVTSETKRGAKIDASLIKSLTGDDTVNARHIFERPVEFAPSWSVFLATNHRPEMPGDDMALWERVKLIPFEVRIPDDKKDTTLKDKLMAEAPGILAWMVEGARSYIDHGLTDPEAIVEATAEYQTESDPVGDFISRCLELRPGDDSYLATSGDLRQAWVGYCDENDVMGIEARQIGMRLKAAHGRTLITSKTVRIKGEYRPTRAWLGFRLNDEGENMRDHGEGIEHMQMSM